MPTTESNICPVCIWPLQGSPRLSGDPIKFDCSRCGGFFFSRSAYDDVFFPQQTNQDRRDTLSQITLRVSWKINRHWLLNYSYSHQKNNSNVQIFGYDRDVTGVSLRRILR